MSGSKAAGNFVSLRCRRLRRDSLTIGRRDLISSARVAPVILIALIADTWDPSKLPTDGCKPYGAAAVMRVPGRLRISWDNDSTLKIETDAGQQTRLLRFGGVAPAKTASSWQGYSAAEWEKILQPGGLGVSLQTAPPRMGTLKVVTTNLRPGYLRKNGVPYRDATVVTEYFDTFSELGSEWLTVITLVDDPKYLSQQFITSTHFKREADGSKWMPAPCT
jgi:hypothetical protein